MQVYILTPEKENHDTQDLLFPSEWNAFLYSSLWGYETFIRFYVDMIVTSKINISFDAVAVNTVFSGVIKGRRARHLPRPPLFWGPLVRYYAHKFSLFLVKDVLFTHVMCYKANHKQVFCFQRAPYRNCNVQVLCFQRGRNSNWNMYVLCC